MAEGLGNAEIGERLGLAEKTVKHYMTSLFEKLGARSRVGGGLRIKAGMGHGSRRAGARQARPDV